MTDDPTADVLPAAERLVVAFRDRDGEGIAAAFQEARDAVQEPYQGDTVLACALAGMVPDPRRTPVELLLAWAADPDDADQAAEDPVDFEDQEEELLAALTDRSLPHIARYHAAADLVAGGYTPENVASRLNITRTTVYDWIRQSRRARGNHRPCNFGRTRGDGRPKPPVFTAFYIHELVERAESGDLDFATMIMQLREDLDGWEPLTASVSSHLVELVAANDHPTTKAPDLAAHLGVSERHVVRARRVLRENPDLIDVA